MILILLYAPYILFSIITSYCGRLFSLAGIDKSHATKPLINIFYWLKIARIRPIFTILFFLPYINLLFIAVMVWLIIRSFQPRNTVFTVWGPIAWFVGLPILNNKDVVYNKSDASLVHWKLVSIDVVLFILLKRSIINTFIFSVYAIPTSSMEKTFMTGDLVLAERISIGPRLPVTPLSLPFFHSRLPNSYKPSYLSAIQLPYFRFPATTAIQRNDVLVFNYPVQSQYPVDKREYYMKRCVALPGDTFEVVDGVVQVNGVSLPLVPTGQRTYLVKTDGTNIEMPIYTKLGITEGGKYGDEPGLYILGLTQAAHDSLKAYPYVKSIVPSIKPKGMIDAQRYYYPADTTHIRWNSDQYGPLVIPKKGMTVKVNQFNHSIYLPLIEKYERASAMEPLGPKGTTEFEYTFKMNYYFMMGDNRDNSEDSRFWGLVPEDHIDSKVWKAFHSPIATNRPLFHH